MKNRATQSRNKSAKRFSRKSLVGIAVAAIVLMIGVVTALSMQSGQTRIAKVEERKPQVVNQSHRNYVTRNAAGQTIAVDRQTGQTRPLTPEEAQRLADGIKGLVNQSTEGLVQVQRSDGSVLIDLQGHFQNLAVAKVNADGSLSQSCVDNLPAAAAFFEIDPQLLEDKATGEAPVKQ